MTAMEHTAPIFMTTNKRCVKLKLVYITHCSPRLVYVSSLKANPTKGPSTLDTDTDGASRLCSFCPFSSHFFTAYGYEPNRIVHPGTVGAVLLSLANT